MSTPILATKLYIPPPRPKAVLRPRLIERLNEGLLAGHKLTLISAPAGFGKTTLVSEWIAGCRRGEAEVRLREPLVRVAWLSLNAGDSDPARFLAYLVAALQTIFAGIGAGVLAALESPQPPPTEPLLTVLLNEIAAMRQEFILVLDDYHLIDAKPVDASTSVDVALAFLLERQPPQMHLVIATREDPQLPLARLRARGQLTELRAADLRFTPAEAAEFLNQVMRLNLSAENIAALEARTEGWIAGLQLAALALQGTISMHGQKDAASFIRSFTGSHHFVLDYLVEEVLGQQPESVQTFLLRTSILDRLCGPLCDAVTDDRRPTTAGERTLSAVSGPSSAVLEYLERANLFIVPLDSERRWYRYHHLFAELLRQRLQQSDRVDQYHIRASQWYEDNGLEVEAFQHAVAANDVERAERLIDAKGLHTHVRGVAVTLDWLASLPPTALDARPSLWMKYASALLVGGQTTGVEAKLQAAEAALQKRAGQTLQDAELDDQTRDLIGQIAAARAMLALSVYQTEAMIIQARRALEYLRPDNLSARFRANLTVANAHLFRGERAAAGRAITDALSDAQASGNILHTSVATIALGQCQELENQLYSAAEAYRRSLQLLGDQLPPVISDAYLGLARICYQWNDLDAAEQHGQQGLQLARQYDREIDTSLFGEMLLARLKLARGDVAGAAAMLAKTERSARQHNFLLRMPEIATVQVLVLLRQDDLAAAAQLAQTHALPISQARVFLAQGDASKALAVLAPLRQQMEAKGWQDERLRVMVLEALALYMQREKDEALQLLGEALALAEPGGFIRLFVDEGEPMRLLIADFRLWIEKQTRGQGQTLLGYVDKLLAAFAPSAATPQSKVANPESTMREPLSQRELEILKLITQGLSNREIGARLFLALDTVKGHNRRIFDKLQVQSRTEAIARARELGLL